ncbi:MAG TPA: helix-turn-helix transcriptional regulator [Gemmatimonadales bacterium]|nr:helix-turn-helix transcriptional regulator [Gemmatimonadales bacterium]
MERDPTDGDADRLWTSIAAGFRRRRAATQRELLDELSLRELRELRYLTQDTVASVMGIQQAGVSRMEKRPALSLRTLQRYVSALGGSLEVVARFPDWAARILVYAPHQASHRPHDQPQHHG